MLLASVIVFAGDDDSRDYTGSNNGDYARNHYFIFASPTYVWTNNSQKAWTIDSIAVNAATAITNTLTLSVSRSIYDIDSELTYTFDPDIWSAAVVGDADIVYSEPVNGFRIIQNDVLTWTKTDATPVIAASTVTSAGTATNIIVDTSASHTVDAYNLGYSVLIDSSYYSIVDTTSNVLTIADYITYTNASPYSIITPIKVVIDGEL